MTFQFKESKLREDAEVPHPVRIEEGDALDGPARPKVKLKTVICREPPLTGRHLVRQHGIARRLHEARRPLQMKKAPSKWGL